MTQPPRSAPEPGWLAYERLKAEYIAKHPHATPDEIEAECKRIARKLGL